MLIKMTNTGPLASGALFGKQTVPLRYECTQVLSHALMTVCIHRRSKTGRQKGRVAETKGGQR